MKRRNGTCTWTSLFALPLLLLSASALAEEAPAARPGQPGLSLELNKLDRVDNGCRLTFVMRNGLDQPIESLGLELALFSGDGAVSGIIALDAGALPTGKTRVKRFVAPDVACTEIGRVLLNDVTRCEGTGLSPQACIARMGVSSRVEKPFVF